MRLQVNLIIIMALLPAPALAADERRLSAAEVERILDAAALKREIANTPTQARPIEGEVGVSIGSGGDREVFGTAIVPVGAEGVAIVTIDTSDYGRRKHRR